MNCTSRGSNILSKICLILFLGAPALGFSAYGQSSSQVKVKNTGQLDLKAAFQGLFDKDNEQGRSFSQSRTLSFSDKGGSSSSRWAKEESRRAFSGEADPSYHKSSKSSFGGSGSSGRVSSSSSGVSRGYFGGCPHRPDPPMNSALRCSMYSGCHAVCHRNYQFPNGEAELFITCKEGEWQIEGVEWETIPHCEPICLPACQHNGICIAPNQCNCPENFRGPQCQFENKPCMNIPPTPTNSIRKCSAVSCTVQCAPNHQFPDGSTITNMVCKDGSWIPSRPDWVSIPDCEVICKPPCLNGGICLSFNMCQCPQNFRGPQCQYDADSCGVQKLGFNGAYNCTSSGTSFSCALSCPVGVDFEFPPASVYTCDYATGLFSPSPIPQCKYGPNIRVITPLGKPALGSNFSSEHGPGLYKTVPLGKGIDAKGINLGMLPKTFPNIVVLENRKPKSGSCFTWGHSHYKTFDGRVYDFTSSCIYTFVRDAVDNTFSVSISNNKGCNYGRECYKNISVFLEDREYVLALDGKGDAMMALNGFQRIAIPSKTREFTIEKVAHFVILTLHSCGVTIRWNTKDFVQVDVSERLWNKTAGLCGPIDDLVDNDFTKKDGTSPKSLLEFVNSWEVDVLENTCSDSASDLDACSRETVEDVNLISQAEKFCQKLLLDPKFEACREVIDVKPYYEACRWDYCECEKLDSVDCACHAISVYVRECSRNGITEMANWRDEMTCPVTCESGKVYSTCGPTVQETCGSVVETLTSSATEPVFCVEGCFCPDGTLLHNEKCIPRSECPCQLRGKQFSPGETVPSDCNTCRCEDGRWACTQVKCGARCASVGDPHYTTFDGRHYNFMGKCSYYLVKGDNYSIEAENVACAGSISEAMNFPASVASGLPSCTKTIIIRYGDQIIKLKQNREVSLNGEEITKVPYSHNGIYIRMVSSIFLLVELANGMEVWWDGMTRAYVDAPADLQGKTKGLCGTFTQNQKDDFLTPEGDVEQSVISFANKWKTSEKCDDLPEKFLEKPCDVNIHNKALAESHCQKLKGSTFHACHWLVDPEPYLQDCLYDMCSCEGKVGSCLCPILSAYSKECANKGIKLDWRMEVRECGIHCPGNQKYQTCGNTCTRSCFDISSRTGDAPCKRRCVEGCNCPEGETLDSRGECIPISDCPCVHQGLQFHPGDKLIMPGARESQICICRNAIWDCQHATDTDMKDYPSIDDLRVTCSSVDNEEFTDCEPAEPVTCKNMHKSPSYSTAKCKTGCKCKKGYVLDTYSKKCIKPTDCPCHHGGRSYGELEKIQEDCNTCTCSSGRWNCTERVCSGICTSWGESHFKTFDGKIYDFHGACDYVFAKGKISKNDVFEVIIQNVPCGSSGVACSKSLTLKVGSSDKSETVTFSKDQALPSILGLKRITVRQAGLFIFAEVQDLGIVLQWDKGTRTYIKANPSWKNKIRGLCGNYNDNELDDFMTPSGGISEVSPVVFGDSWKVQQFCPETYEVKDTCEIHPNRKVWALRRCGILKSEVFQPCHSEVPLDAYLERCTFDTCGCDMGGDCECLCTAIAAYAQECNIRGVPIKWRSQDLCPIQCDESCSHYSPCVETCPKQTCDNQFIHKSLTQLCNEDSCVEGCELKLCPEGEVYQSMDDLKCVPLSSCETVCMTIGNKTYFEGDKIEGDECYSCYCSRHDKVCQGKPCPESTTPQYVTTSQYSTSPQRETKCITGWSPWISNDKPQDLKKFTDIEEISMINSHVISKHQPQCEPQYMKKIECRTVGTKINYKKTGQNVLCSVESGLICDPISEGGKIQPCNDYEIRVYCSCGREVGVTKPTLLPYSETTVEKTTLEEEKCISGWSPWVNNDKPLRFKKKDTDVEGIPTVFLEKDKPMCEQNKITDIECRTAGTHINFNETDQDVECSLEKGLICKGSKGKRCSDYEIRVLCSCELFSTTPVVVTQTSTTAVTLPTLGSTPAVKTICITGWTPWFSNDKPIKFRKKLNDLENIPSEISYLPHASCEKSRVAKIECRTTESHLHFKKTGQDVKCNLDEGLICNPSYKGGKGLSCYDYEIRVFCSCEATQEVTESTTISIVSTSSVGVLPNFTLPTLGPTVPAGTKCVSGWTPWLSKDKPIKFRRKYNDIETLPNVTLLEYGSDQPTCHQSLMKEIECRTVGKHVDYRITGQDVECSLDKGLVCEPTQGNVCFNYEIRVLCECETSVETCQDGLGMESGSIMDDQISVSSISTPGHLGNHARLNGEGAWVAGTKVVPNEWIKVDLLDQKEITGVIIQGNPVSEEWVEEFQVGWSNDGDTWVPLRDEGSLLPKIFDGNTDAQTPKRVLFEKPIFAQYIKLIPVQVHDWISLRLEVLGCDVKGITVGPTTVKTTVSTTVEVCDPAHPNFPHETDCHIFYHCADTLDGIKMVEKTCGPHMMFHPEKQICDWPAAVIEIRPECSGPQVQVTTPSVIRTTPTTVTTSSACPPGKVWSNCAIKCNQVCLHFDYILHQRGFCPDKQKCIYGCVDEYENSCPEGSFWRDRDTCLQIEDCTCVSHTGLPVKPGQVHRESDCEICQCENNVYRCDRSACMTSTTVISVISSNVTTKSTPEVFTVTEPTATIPTGHDQKKYCDDWIPWFNEGSPKGTLGDFESIDSVKKKYDYCSYPTGIECVTVRDEKPSSDTGNVVTCDLKGGLKCYNKDNGEEGCEDYKIRLYCLCEKSTSITTVTQSSSVGTTGPTITPIPCDRWSEWINDSGKSKEFGIEREHKTIEQLHDMGFCIDGEIKEIECRDVKTGLLYSETWDKDVSCSLSTGLLCENEAQSKSRPCKDYKIRYFCSCGTTTISTTTLVITPSVTPPAECDRNRFIPLINGPFPLSDAAFSASSTKSPKHGPQGARLESHYSTESGEGWIPLHQNKDQFLQVDLGTSEPVYGVIVQGSAEIPDMYVTSYHVLHSEDGQKFIYAKDDSGNPKLFRGPIDTVQPVEEVFFEPFEARYIRLNPQTWKNGISLKADVIGCGESVTTLTSVTPTSIILTTPFEVLCKDEMGLENGMMNDEQVEVSSVFDNDDKFSAPNVRLNIPKDASHGGAWIPATNSINEWVKFDFLEPRNLTGVITQGQDKDDSWVESFKVAYSHDGIVWNPVLEADGSEKVFLGNFDDHTPVENYFGRPIQARYLKIMPLTWHNNIALRTEVLGCFHPYPPVSTPIPETTTTPPPKDCMPCPNLPSEILKECISCSGGLLWDGSDCVQKSECQCYVGHIPYSVGTVYSTEDCEQCICKLGGVPSCQEKKCPKCEKGLRSELTPQCGCVCKPCPPNTRICPTTEICIEEDLWCNGVEDCPDDERNCPTTTATVPTECPPPDCPPGYTVHLKSVTPEFEAPFSRMKALKGRTKGTMRTKGVKGTKPLKIISACPPYDCIPIVSVSTTPETCITPECPEGFEVQITKTDKSLPGTPCPQFECVPVPPPPPPTGTVCDVNGRSFETFDGMDYNYDICHHILAKDLLEGKWSVEVHKNCSTCPFSLIIKQDAHTVKLNNDITIEYGSYSYTLPQAKKIGSRHKEFVISKVGDTIHFESNHYGFWVDWDGKSSARVGVSPKLLNGVVGLCGFYSDDKSDDRQMPDGSEARSNKDFGDSWSIAGSEVCEAKVCPTEMQNIAWEICSLAKTKPFIKCKDLMNVDKFVSQCLETVCVCLEKKHNSALAEGKDLNPNWEDECRCDALLDFATQCKEKEPSFDLSDWRVALSCPAICPPGEVYKDCFIRQCEPSCETLMDEEPCSVVNATCYSGCFCPDGFVRKGDACVPPSECRDCTCDCFGDPHYLTFDRTSYTFNGNCTYVAARDINPGGDHEFQVLVKNKECIEKTKATCTHAVTVLYGKHYVHIERVEEDGKIAVILDGKTLITFPFSNEWVKLENLGGKEVTLLIPSIQLEVSYFFDDYAFVIRLPSHLFGDNTEGLCSNCNKNKTDDLKKNDGALTDDIDDFGTSWLTQLPPELGFEEEKDCQVPVILACPILPPNEDPCLNGIMDEIKFGQCHPVVNPAPYLEACQKDLCNTSDKNRTVCQTLEAYARECAREGICLEWRTSELCPFECPSGLEYHQCGSGCLETCDNHKLYHDKTVICSMSSIDGCYCPSGKVWKDNKCVEVSMCKACDEEGHFPGDIWYPNTCEECSCSESTKTCKVKTCPALETVCDSSMRAVKLPESEDECCPKYICEPVITPTPAMCEEAQKPECGYGQEMKITTSISGCREYICVCVPIEKCEPLVPFSPVEVELDEEDLMPGIEKWIDRSGCCPKFEDRCNVTLCPPKLTCPEHHSVVELPPSKSTCCPEYQCTPPDEMCIYEQEYTPGGEILEKPLNEGETITIVKKVGEKWYDGPCKECTCIETEEEVAKGAKGGVKGKGKGAKGGRKTKKVFKASCSRISCPSIEEHPDSEEYVLDEVSVPEKCCPNIIRTACQDEDKVYQEGETLKISNCKKVHCAKGPENKLAKQEIVETCNKECQKGWEYVEPPTESEKCCGECKQVSCVTDEDKLVTPGSKWTTNDGCTIHVCEEKGEQLQIISSEEQCPSIDDCLPENVYFEKCCKRCNATEKCPPPGACAPADIEPELTVGLINENKDYHGNCINPDPIPGFKECKGNCQSSTFFDLRTLSHQANCKCCQATTTKSITVKVACEDGYNYERKVTTPTGCSCNVCESGKAEKIKGSTKTTTKHGVNFSLGDGNEK